MLVSALGLAIFNLFMVVPAMVYGSLLAALYACALGFYLGGIAITASGLSGASELVPTVRCAIHDHVDRDDFAQTRVSINDTGINVYQERARKPRPNAPPMPTSEDREGEHGAAPNASSSAPNRWPARHCDLHRHGRRLAHHPDLLRHRHGAGRHHPVPSQPGDHEIHLHRHQALYQMNFPCSRAADHAYLNQSRVRAAGAGPPADRLGYSMLRAQGNSPVDPRERPHGQRKPQGRHRHQRSNCAVRST
jgi:hypothetical protein